MSTASASDPAAAAVEEEKEEEERDADLVEEEEEAMEERDADAVEEEEEEEEEERDADAVEEEEEEEEEERDADAVEEEEEEKKEDKNEEDADKEEEEEKRKKKRQKQKRTITLRTADGKDFEVDVELAAMSNVIKAMIEDGDGDGDGDGVASACGVVPLPRVRSATLEMVIAFWEDRARAKHELIIDYKSLMEAEREACGGGGEGGGGEGDGGGEEEVKDWRVEFLEKVERRDLAFDLIRAASYLDAQALFDEMVSYFVGRIRDMSVDEVREFFGIAGGYAPGDDWVFDP